MRDSFPADKRAPAKARRAVRTWLNERGADPARLGDVLLAVSEVVTNCVVHAYRESGNGVVAMEAHHRGDTLVLSVADHGMGMSPRTDSPGLGLGLPLVGRIAERVDIVAPAEGGTQVRMSFALGPGTAGDQAGQRARTPGGPPPSHR
jgi:anti-sigma regulatory factor (Ser/Thr protein kinase)